MVSITLSDIPTLLHLEHECSVRIAYFGKKVVNLTHEPLSILYINQKKCSIRRLQLTFSGRKDSEAISTELQLSNTNADNTEAPDSGGGN